MIKTIILLLLCLALSATTNAGLIASNPMCAPVAANMHSCSDVLRRGDPSAITPRCCDGLRAIEAQECVVGVEETCRCLSQCLRAQFRQILETVEGVGTSITALMKSHCKVEISCL